MEKKEPPLIETRDLCKSYFNGVETAVLHDIDLVIEKNEFVAIMGPSGSGKSTLMHILGFLDIPTSGQFFYHGKHAGEMDDDALAQIRATRVGFVFQAFNLLPRTTVLENVMLPLLYHPTIPRSERHDRALAAIDAVGLQYRKDYVTNQLSGGEKQRTAIARALVTDPEIIFADEPTGNLDSLSGSQVLEALQKLHDDGHTIIVVTHEKRTAEHAQRILHILDGRISEDKRDFKQRIANNNEHLK